MEIENFIAANDLQVDMEYVEKEMHNPVTAVARFGHDTTSSHYHRLAGYLHAHLLKQQAAQSTEEYVQRFKKNLHPEIAAFMLKHKKQLDHLMKDLDEWNYKFYYLGAANMNKSYALSERFDIAPSETPVQVYIRNAVQMYHKRGIKDIVRCATDQAKGYYSLATPALSSSSTVKNQTASCYIINVDDNIESIADKIFRCPAIISSHGGGLGINLSYIRHSEISTRGMSKGVIPLARIINKIMLYADQRNKRKGAANLCLQVWHIDIEEFIQLTRKTGQQKEDSTDTLVEEPFEMFTTVMTNWLFMQRAEKKQKWTLFCPSKVPDLHKKYGKEFIEAYLRYEKDPTIPAHAKKEVDAALLASLIFKTRLNTGSPYSVDIDAINIKNPLGDSLYINCPNLCLEVLQYCDADEIAVCNLASICLPSIIKEASIDYDKLAYITRELVNNLNQLIDTSTNSVEEANIGAKNRRSLGIGVQGFADMLYMLDLHFEHPLTRDINKKIAACIYWNALASSVDKAIETGETYKGFEHSHAKQGLLQFDLWRKEYTVLKELGFIDDKIRSYTDDDVIEPSEWNQKPFLLSNDEYIQPTWRSLKAAIQKYGLYNAHVTCQQPTATTSLINNNCEMKEAPIQNIYTRELMKKEFTVINIHLERDLRALNLWDRDIIQHIIDNQGSIALLPLFLNEHNYHYDHERLNYLVIKYKTMYEIKNRTMLQLTADAGRYICQSQSTNLYFDTPDINKIKGAFFLASKLGLKTTSYYTRIKSYTTPSFISDKTKKKSFICTDEVCTACI